MSLKRVKNVFGVIGFGLFFLGATSFMISSRITGYAIGETVEYTHFYFGGLGLFLVGLMLMVVSRIETRKKISRR